MTLPVRLLLSAKIDYDESFRWYDQQSENAANEFSNEIDHVLSRIARSAEVFAFVDEKHQSCPVKRFPFRIIFRTLDDQILVVAISHSSRRPEYWHTSRG